MSKNELSIVDKAGIENPGDNISARVTETGRKVVKVEKNRGADKYSATQYPNGTIVETKTTKPR